MKRRLAALAVCVVILGSFAAAQITPDRLARASNEPHNWLMYSGGYFSQR